MSYSGKKIVFPILCLIALCGCIAGNQQPSHGDLQAFFCPRDNCAAQLIKEFDSAKQSIHVAIYSFTEDRIARALIGAHKRGVKVMVLFDAGQAESAYSEDEPLESAGIAVKRMQKDRGIMHDKFAVIDSNIVATGSFNYSQNADLYNNENLLFVRGPQAAGEYESEFQRIWNAG